MRLSPSLGLSSHPSLVPASALSALVALAAPGCDDGGGGSANENEVITSVVLAFTPTGTGGGLPATFTFNDPDGDGGAAPTIDTIDLTYGVTYNATVKLENRLETPAEDITVEVADESDQHQIFFTGTGVSGPASDQPRAALVHAYADVDANGLPIGLANSFMVRGGIGNLTVTLRHLPPVNDQPTKTAAAATTVKDSGFATLGGSTDAMVTFPVTIAVP
jgi:hypothetical protein